MQYNTSNLLHFVISHRPYLAERAIFTDRFGKVVILKRATTTQCTGNWCYPRENVNYGQTMTEALRW